MSFDYEERIQFFHDWVHNLEEKIAVLEKALCKSEDEYDDLVQKFKEFVKEVEK